MRPNWEAIADVLYAALFRSPDVVIEEDAPLRLYEEAKAAVAPGESDGS